MGRKKTKMNSNFECFENDDVVAAVLPQTDQSQFSFPAGFWHEIEHALSGTGFWHQKSMTD